VALLVAQGSRLLFRYLPYRRLGLQHRRHRTTGDQPLPVDLRTTRNFQAALIVDDNMAETNLAYCGGMARPTRPWCGRQTDPNGGPFGDVDLHQLGTGYGGRSLFTHLEDTGDALWGGTMT